HAYRTTANTRNVNALNANTAVAPARATRTPAMAGPPAGAAFMLIAPSADADASCGRGTSSGMTAWYVGAVIAAPQPSVNVSNSSSAGGICPAAVSTASVTPTA